MPGDAKNPDLKSFHIDGGEFEDYAEDAPPGALQGLLFTHEDFSKACDEVFSAHAQYGATAGIPDGDIKDLTEANARIARIDAFLPAYLKAAEVLTETRAKLDDKRQRLILDAANSVDRRAGKTPVLLAKYEKTRAYRSAIALKGVKTKAENAKQAAEAAEAAKAAQAAQAAQIAEAVEAAKAAQANTAP
jgi:hypothetical protein